MNKAPVPVIVTGPLVGSTDVSGDYAGYDPIIYSVWLANGTLVTRPSGFTGGMAEEFNPLNLGAAPVTREKAQDPLYAWPGDSHGSNPPRPSAPSLCSPALSGQIGPSIAQPLALFSAARPKPTTA